MAVYRIGRKYKVRIKRGDTEITYFNCVLREAKGPMLTFNHAVSEIVISTDSAAFVSADPQD